MTKRPYWKTISKMIVEIQINPRRQCWRIVTGADRTTPIPNEQDDYAVCPIGGETYSGSVALKRKQKL